MTETIGVTTHSSKTSSFDCLVFSALNFVRNNGLASTLINECVFVGP